MSNELLKSMINGFENFDGPVSSDTIYAAALMGGEGFMDTIKEGAKASIAWIKQLLNNILDAILFWFGGRSRVVKALNDLKRSKFFEVFRPNISVLVDKYALPAAAIAYSHTESAIDEEYQSFFRQELPETPEVNRFFVSVNSMSEILKRYIRDARTNPTEKHLDFSDILGKAKDAMEAGRKIVSKFETEKDPNNKLIFNLNSVITKIGKAVNVLNNASESIARNIEKENK